MKRGGQTRKETSNVEKKCPSIIEYAVSACLQSYSLIETEERSPLSRAHKTHKLTGSWIALYVVKWYLT